MSTHDEPHTDRDLLIARIIDADAGPGDWERFRAEASRDPTIWRELSDAQSDHEALRESVRAAGSVADRVGLPIDAMGSHQRRFDAAARWSGWGVAAMVALAWIGGALSGPAPTPNGAGMVQTGSLTPLQRATPDEALGRYLDAGRARGRVVGEMPDPVIVETRPTGSGSIEVIYLRQIIERREVDRAYRRVSDEFGNPGVVPVELGTIGADRAF